MCGVGTVVLRKKPRTVTQSEQLACSTLIQAQLLQLAAAKVLNTSISERADLRVDLNKVRFKSTRS